MSQRYLSHRFDPLKAGSLCRETTRILNSTFRWIYKREYAAVNKRERLSKTIITYK